VADTNEQTPQSEPEAPKKNRKPLVIGIVVVIAVIALFFYWRSTFTQDTDDAQVDGNLYQVSSRVSGQVIDVKVTEEQLVHKGDLIAVIDPTDYQVAVDQAEADLATAEAQYQQASTGVPITSVNARTQVLTSGSDVATATAQVSQAEAQVAAADARIAQARANALKAQLDVDRYTPLVQKDVISKQQFDQAVAVNDANKASLDEAQRNAKASRDNVNQATAKLAMSQAQSNQSRVNAPKQIAVQQAQANAAKASIQQAQARVDQAKLNLGYTKVTAPEDGIVSKKSVVVGANLSVGQSLVTIVPLTNLWVTANFKETQLAEMKVGQKVKLEVDALGGRKFSGTITQVGGATGSSLSLFPPENATGNYVKVVQRIPVRIDFTDLKDENKDDALRIGMSVEPVVRVKD
jgi:membrane fusion protein (multidrug efflux system)